ncbi:MAG TPA: 50S ribosomal protein L1, partial [Chloroflexota bacterium]|nr:50S ribosomal protein L1 [Chloroflexota bacterium]
YKHGKKYRQAEQLVEPEREYQPEEAVDLVRKVSTTNFPGTVELHVRLGVDVRHADQQVRGTVVLPFGTGRTQRIIAFAEGEKAREAEEAGADVVGAEDLVQRIQGGWLDFDVAIATPDMMRHITPLGRVLGPRGLMPNPRTGTVTQDIGKAIEETKKGRVEFRTDRTGIVHVPVGKTTFEPDQLLANLATVMEALMRAKPQAAKGTYVRSATLSPTMGPGVPLETAAASALHAA